jgi:uroporphyrinogen decarboxylase
MAVKSYFLSVRQKQVFDFIHSRTDAKVFYHSCGSVYDLIPEVIEIGVDILNPVQASAAKNGP